MEVGRDLAKGLGKKQATVARKRSRAEDDGLLGGDGEMRQVRHWRFSQDLRMQQAAKKSFPLYKSRRIFPGSLTCTRKVPPTCAIPLIPKVFLERTRTFRDCSRAVAQRQFSLEYPRLLSILSNECLSEGLSPMSTWNVSKEFFHSSQTFMPRPP